MAGVTGYRDERRAHFTFIWAIENYFPLELDLLVSPVFTVKSMEMTKWSLGLRHSSGAISLYLYKEGKNHGPKEIELDYELSFLDANGIPLIEGTKTMFSRYVDSGFDKFADVGEVFSSRKAQFLPRGVLTVRCRMWRKGTETIQKPDVCFGRTRFSKHRRHFIWAIKDFGSLSSGYKTTRLLKSASDGAPLLTLVFSLEEYNGEEYVSIVFDNRFPYKSPGVIGEICLLDVEGAVVYCEKIWQFCSFSSNNSSLSYKKQTLVSDKTTLLPNNVLSLRCDFDVYYGPLWGRIDNCAQLQSSARSDMKENIVEESESIITSCPFKQNICKFYEDGTLSDISLRADTETFPVHKIILSSRSPVFKAMFTNDMREKTSKCIDVSDVDAGTLRHLLLYIYTNEVPKVEWDKAADLLTAADKYELLELKKKCSTILMSNLSRASVCRILSVADLHHEEELRKAVLDFLSQNSDILSSETWKIFKKDNSELAMETMERIIYSVTNTNQKI